MATNYHQLRVWQVAMENLGSVFQDLPSLKGLADVSNQMQRCAQSVAANISEGAGRGSDGDFRRFLCIARASNNELETWYRVAFKAGRISKNRLQVVSEQIVICGKMLSVFIKKLEGS